MDHDAILTRLTALFQEMFDDDALGLTPETTAEDVPGWDSMRHIAVVVEIERRFGVKFLTTEIEALSNVGAFIALIKTKAA